MENGQTNNGQDQKDINLKRYETDVSGVSLQKLEAGLWWTKNRQKLKTILIVLLIIIGAAGWGYTLFGFGEYLFVGMNRDAQLTNSLVQSGTVSQDYLTQKTAKDLQYSSVGFIANSGKYDLYALVKNVNAGHYGTFSYCFTTGSGEQACGSDFILPGESKYVLLLAQGFSSSPSGVVFSVSNAAWRRIDRHAIPDWKSYRDEHLDISIKKAVYTPAADNALSDKVGLNNLSFSASNNGAFGYFSAPLTIVLSDGGRIAGVNRYVITDFASYDQRDIQITWPGTIGPVNNISITPDINIMDSGVFEQPQ